MKKLIFTFTLFLCLTSFSVSAKDLYFDCHGDHLKVVTSFFGKNKLYSKIGGEWLKSCGHEGDIISNDNFKCYTSSNALPHVEFWTFDFKYKEKKYFKGKAPFAEVISPIIDCQEVE